MNGLSGIGSSSAVFGIDDKKVEKQKEQQPQVAFGNSIFEGYFNNSNNGSTTAAFNA
jgi:hypothetical protein